MNAEIPRHRRKKALLLSLLCVLLLLALPRTAYADMGPKPSVQIHFTGSSGEAYYGTLLSETSSTGPATAWNGRKEYAQYREGEYEIWKAFVEYEDKDGYYFLQELWDCSETGELKWIYYPPSPFKILLYFPETDSFYVSPVYERYAFDSYFTVDLSEDPAAGLTAKRSYDHGREFASLAIRITFTVLLELGVALLFAYREKWQLRFLALVNVITQIVLHLLLNLIHYYYGGQMFVFGYCILEFVVFGLEALLYVRLLPRCSKMAQKRGRAVVYALVANGFSFLVGLWLAERIPGIF